MTKWVEQWHKQRSQYKNVARHPSPLLEIQKVACIVHTCMKYNPSPSLSYTPFFCLLARSQSMLSKLIQTILHAIADTHKRREKRNDHGAGSQNEIQIIILSLLSMVSVWVWVCLAIVMKNQKYNQIQKVKQTELPIRFKEVYKTRIHSLESI